MGVLTRSEMEQTIIQRGSVLYRGRIISRIQDLPSDADLAAGDPAQEAAAAAALDAQIAALQAQRARIGAGGASPEIGPLSSPTVTLDSVAGADVAERLRASGIADGAALAHADDDTLLAIEGVGPATLKKLRAAFGGG